MVSQLFDALFIVTLAGLLLAVPVGLLLLAWPRRIRTASPAVSPHGASARA